MLSFKWLWCLGSSGGFCTRPAAIGNSWGLLGSRQLTVHSVGLRGERWGSCAGCYCELSNGVTLWVFVILSEVQKCPLIWFSLAGTIYFYPPVRATDVAKEEAAVLHQRCHIWERQQVLVQSHRWWVGHVPCPQPRVPAARQQPVSWAFAPGALLGLWGFPGLIPLWGDAHMERVRKIPLASRNILSAILPMAL